MQRDEALEILAKHRPAIEALGVRSVAVFGSVARNQARPDSDVDILVEINRPLGYFKFLDIEEYLASILEKRVDLFTLESLRDDIRDTVTKEAIRAA